MKQYKKILFDLDNTLVDDYENRKYAIKKILLDKEEKATEERIESFLKLDDQHWKDRSEGKIKDPYEFKTNEEKAIWIRALRFIKYFKDISFEEAVVINEKYMQLIAEHIVPIENAQNIMKYLYEKQYEIYIVTNGPAVAVESKLSKINSKMYVKDIFTADHVGYMKPHKEFFEGFFKKTNNYEKEKMLIIGDDLEKDVLGGLQSGIDSCWFNRNKENNNIGIEPTYEINNLSELKNIL